MGKSKSRDIYEISYSLKQERRRFVRNAALFAAAFFLGMNALLSFVICPVQQKSLSMEPNVPRGTLVFATPIKTKIKRGEIVLISREDKSLSAAQKAADFIIRSFTLQKLSFGSPKKDMMRRIAALPGDTIYMKDFILYVQPKSERHFFTEFELNQIPYSVDISVPPANWSPEIGARGSFDKLTLGEDEYYVLGDNRLSCIDSRVFGKIGGGRIKKRVLMNFFPFKFLKIFAASKQAQN